LRALGLAERGHVVVEAVVEQVGVMLLGEFDLVVVVERAGSALGRRFSLRR
jgi:hypothetical protein